MACMPASVVHRYSSAADPLSALNPLYHENARSQILPDYEAAANLLGLRARYLNPKIVRIGVAMKSSRLRHRTPSFFEPLFMVQGGRLAGHQWFIGVHRRLSAFGLEPAVPRKRPITNSPWLRIGGEFARPSSPVFQSKNRQNRCSSAANCAFGPKPRIPNPKHPNPRSHENARTPN